MTIEVPALRAVPDSAPSASTVSAVSWAAIIAGAFAAVAISLILLALGTGFGLSSISPWSHANLSVATFSLATAIWLVVVQWLSAALGGYLTGRLRTRWIGLHTHEVAFRDTVHGFLAWALATVVGAILLGSVAPEITGGATHAASALSPGSVQAASSNYGEARNYAIDSLFRPSKPGPNESLSGDARAEVARIFSHVSETGGMSASDHEYLVSLVATRTGLSTDEAEKRVDRVTRDEKAAETNVRSLVDKARRATAAAAIFLAVSMLVGAFIGSAAAALGGLRRDEHPQ
jgi:hypothetical protein